VLGVGLEVEPVAETAGHDALFIQARGVRDGRRGDDAGRYEVVHRITAVGVCRVLVEVTRQPFLGGHGAARAQHADGKGRGDDSLPEFHG
jgi:hypothetical protein